MRYIFDSILPLILYISTLLSNVFLFLNHFIYPPLRKEFTADYAERNAGLRSDLLLMNHAIVRTLYSSVNIELKINVCVHPRRLAQATPRTVSQGYYDEDIILYLASGSFKKQ